MGLKRAEPSGKGYVGEQMTRKHLAQKKDDLGGSTWSVNKKREGKEGKGGDRSIW